MVSLIKASFTKRKSNFTYSETDLLLKELEDNKDTLLAASGTCKYRKRAMWDEITMKINNIGEGDERTMEEVRKKWSDMQCLAKRKFVKGKQELNEFEVRVLAMRGDGDRISGREGSFEADHDDLNFEFDTLSEPDIQIKQEKQDLEYDHPPVYFNGSEDIDHVQDQGDEYPETPIPFDLSSPRKRKCNFSALERNALIEEVKKYRNIIMSKSNDTVTHERKRQVWIEVTAFVNRQGRGHYRSVEEVRKKWNDMQSLARRKKRKKRVKTEPPSDPNSDGLHGKEPTQDESMDIDGIEEASRSVDGTEEGNSLDNSDIMERVMASAYSHEAEADQEEIDLIEEDADDSNESNCSEWTPGSRRKHTSSSNKSRKGNFTTVETNILLDEIFKRRKIIFSPNLDRKSTEMKRQEWNRVAERISQACNKDLRTLNEVRKKWSDLYTRASKFKSKPKKRTPPMDLNFESDIDKINKRVLYIMEQKDEEQRKHDEEFEESMFGKQEDNEEENPPILKMESQDGDSFKGEFDNISQEGSHETDDLESGIIIVQVQDGHKKGEDKVVDVINLKKEPPSQPASVDSALVIGNVSTIDEKLFSSMDTHEVSPPPDDKSRLDVRNHGNKNRNRASPRNVSSTTSYEEPHNKRAEQFIFRKRKGKFTSRETLILLEEVRKYKSLLLSKLSTGNINEKKMCKWNDIVAKINNTRSGVPRTIEEVKKKWYDLQCNAKKKRALQESLFERLKDQEKGLGEDIEQMPAHLVRSHSKLLSLLGTAGVNLKARLVSSRGNSLSKADIAVQADCESEGSGEDQDLETETEKIDDFNSNSNDANGPISTDKIRENVTLNVKSVPNMLTNTDWKVLEITDGRVSELANYAAMDHNYHDHAFRSKNKISPSKPEDLVYVPENQVEGLKISSVVSHADVFNKIKLKSPAKKTASEDTASTVSHINADIAHQRLRVERKRLIVEKRRLNIEQEKLRLLRRLVSMEEDKATAREKKRKAREEKKTAKRAKRKARSESVTMGVTVEENGIAKGIERLAGVCKEMTSNQKFANMNFEEDGGISKADDMCREEDGTAGEEDGTAEEEDGTVREEDGTAREYEEMSNVSDTEERHDTDGEMEEGSVEDNMSERGEESNVEEEINNDERSEDEQSDCNESVSDDDEHNVALSYLQCD